MVSRHDLLTQSKNGLSAMALGRQLGVSYNTAWSLKHKLMQVMKERDESGRLGHIVQVDDAYLGGETRGGKRGRGAQGKTPLVAAVQVTEEGRPVALRMSCVKGFRKQEIAAWAHRHLRRETVVYSDGLACFRGVEEAGCEHRPRVTGGGPGSCEAPGLGWVNTVLGNVKRALDGTYTPGVRNMRRAILPNSPTASTAATNSLIWFLDSLMSLCRLLRCPIAC